MKKGDQHIDKLAKQLLSDVEIQAPKDSWERIAKDLDHPKKKVIPLYKQFEFIAAAIVILGVFISSIFMFNDKQIETVKNKNAIALSPDSTIEPTPPISTKEIKPINEANDHIEIAIEEKPINTNKQVHKETETILIERSRLAFAPIDFIAFNDKINYTSTLSKHYAIKLDEDLDSWQASFADELNAQKEDILKQRSNLWKLGLAYSPTYSNNSSPSQQNRALATEFSGSGQSYLDEKTKTTFSIGVNISYALTKKVSIQSGLYYQKHQNEIASNQLLVNAEDINNIRLTKTASGNINISNDFQAQSSTGLEYLLNSDNTVAEVTPNTNLLQNFAYLEIPLMVSYKLLDSQFDISLQSGIHTGFVINNGVSMSNFSSQNIGKTENVNSVIFRSVLGISFEYPLGKQFFFNFSPSYKYQLNNLNNSGSSKSRFNFFDLKTGISYRF